MPLQSEPAGRQGSAGADLPQTVLKAFQGQIAPVRVSASYLLGLLGATGVMLLLPLVYIGIVGGVAYGVYWYSIAAKGLLQSSGRIHGRAILVPLFLYAAPLIIGAVLVLFMLRALLRFPTRQPEQRKLPKLGEPLLFAFVERIAQTVGAPLPAKIQVDCDANASASFRRGFLGVLRNDLVLTIGLPLAGTLNMREFAGVLAHELGHFSQPLAMRLTFVIFAIQNWFARAVYGTGDRPLITADSDVVQSHWSVGIIYLLSCLFVALTRSVLWVLMMAGRAACAFLLREMEYNADRFEMEVAGSEAFEATVRKLQITSVASALANRSLGNAWAEGRLPNDLPSLIVHKTQAVDGDIQKELKANQLTEQTGWFDTHPADHDRVLASRRCHRPGIFALEMPTTMLFRDFTALSRTATLDYYKESLGGRFRPESVRSTGELVAQEKGQETSAKNAERYFQADIPPMRPIPLRAFAADAPANAQALAAEIRALRESACGTAPAYREALKKLLDIEDRIGKAKMALMLATYNCPFEARAFGLRAATKDTADEALLAAQSAQPAAVGAVSEYEALCGQRLVAAVKLIGAPQIAGLLPDGGKMREETAELVAVAQFCADLLPALDELDYRHSRMVAAFNHGEGREKDERYASHVWYTAGEARDGLSALHQRLRNVVYPFENARGTVTLQEYAIPEVPPLEEPGDLDQACAQAVERLYGMYHRIVTRLAAIADAAERAAGIEPMPEVVTKKGELSRLREQQGRSRQTAVPVPLPSPARPSGQTAALVPPPPRPASQTAAFIPPPPPPKPASQTAAFIPPPPAGSGQTDSKRAEKRPPKHIAIRF